MDYKIVTSTRASSLTDKVNGLIKEGWKPKGSHKVLVESVQNRYSGSQLRRSDSTMIYSQTMIKK